jgi:hypothetical protein
LASISALHFLQAFWQHKSRPIMIANAFGIIKDSKWAFIHIYITMRSS